jgi:hypothetical protein
MAADPARRQPVAGDLRLLVTQVKHKTTAALFRTVVPGTTDPVKYESPIGSAQIDRVEDVSHLVELKWKKRVKDTGKMKHNVPILITYTECVFSIPLSTLGLKTPQAGQTLTGDIGLLLGQPGATADRLYWHNKGSSLTADLPTEARLTPASWGKILFVAGR